MYDPQFFIHRFVEVASCLRPLPRSGDRVKLFVRVSKGLGFILLHSWVLVRGHIMASCSIALTQVGDMDQRQNKITARHTKSTTAMRIPT